MYVVLFDNTGDDMAKTEKVSAQKSKRYRIKNISSYRRKSGAVPEN